MRKSTRAFALAVSLVLICPGSPGQNSDQYLSRVRAVQNRPETRAAFKYIDEHRDQILHEWGEITEVNAPSGQEKKRAAYVYRLLKKLKLDELRYDGAGNVIAVRKGTGGGPASSSTRIWTRSSSRASTSNRKSATGKFTRPASATTRAT